MNEKFTPGPWMVWSCFRKKNGKLPVVHDEYGDTVTICEVIDDKEHPEIADADAALIAAAPEMYRKLEWLQREFDESDDEELVAIGWEIELIGWEIELILKKARGEK